MNPKLTVIITVHSRNCYDPLWSLGTEYLIPLTPILTSLVFAIAFSTNSQVDRLFSVSMAILANYFKIFACFKYFSYFYPDLFAWILFTDFCSY